VEEMIIKVETFMDCGIAQLERDINDFLLNKTKEGKKFEFVNIKFSAFESEGHHVYCALMVYKINE
jgi:hypothetical protein